MLTGDSTPNGFQVFLMAVDESPATMGAKLRDLFGDWIKIVVGNVGVGILVEFEDEERLISALNVLGLGVE